MLFIIIFLGLNLLIGISYNKIKNKFIQIQNCMSLNEFKINYLNQFDLEATIPFSSLISTSCSAWAFFIRSSETNL